MKKDTSLLFTYKKSKVKSCKIIGFYLINGLGTIVSNCIKRKYLRLRICQKVNWIQLSFLSFNCLLTLCTEH